MKKKTLLLLLILFLFSPILFAIEVTGNWYWATDDWDIKYFRYQLDGQADDGWTVLDSNVYSVTIKSINGDVEHTLYVQQSYDGNRWSESAEATSDVYISTNGWDDSVEEDTTWEENTDFYDDWGFDENTVEETELAKPIEETPMVKETPVITEEEVEEEVKVLLPYLERHEISFTCDYYNSLKEDKTKNLALLLNYKDFSSFGFPKKSCGVGWELSAGALVTDLDFTDVKLLFREGPTITIYSGSSISFICGIFFQQLVPITFDEVQLAGVFEIGMGAKLNSNWTLYGKISAIYAPKDNEQDIGAAFRFGYSY